MVCIVFSLYTRHYRANTIVYVILDFIGQTKYKKHLLADRFLNY